MKPKTSKHDDTPYMVPAFILHDMAQYMIDVKYVLDGITPGGSKGPLEVLRITGNIISKYNPDQPPLTLTHLPSFIDENTQE